MTNLAQLFKNLQDGHTIYITVDEVAEILSAIHNNKMVVKFVPMGTCVFMVINETEN